MTDNSAPCDETTIVAHRPSTEEYHFKRTEVSWTVLSRRHIRVRGEETA